MTSAIRLILTIASLLVSQILWASTVFSLQTLQNLFQSGQRQAAYDYANQHLNDMEGDANFDYLYGVSAIDTGHASQGVFALERVLFAFPDDHVARLELARGYFILEEYSRSRQEFEIVLDTNPPQSVQDTAQVFLDKIRLKEARYRTTSNGYVEFSFGTDDNVNAGLDQDSLNNLLSQGLFNGLNDNSLAQDDTFASITAAWQITHPFSPGWMFNSSITGNLRKNQDFNQFDTATATIQFGVSRLYKESQYKAEILSQQFNLDGDDYRSLNGLNLDWRYSLSQTSSITSGFQFATLDYATQSNRNSDLITFNVNYLRSFASYFNPVFFLTVNLGSENAEDKNDPDAQADTERDILGLRTGIVLGLTNKTALQTAVSFQSSEYAAAPSYQPDTIREDNYLAANINYLWLFKRNWRMDIKFSYSKNDSTINLRDYDRSLISVNLNYAF